MAIRHLLSILTLPAVVLVGVPYLFLRYLSHYDSRWGPAPWAWLPAAAGAALIAAGFALFAWCLALFARVGQGTLAPWDPTRRLVAVGPYRFVRNPMISGVALMLLGQALLRGSWLLAAWAGFFVSLNHVYFVLSEEPGLEKRFGEPYRRYKANVPRWVPRLHPWDD